MRAFILAAVIVTMIQVVEVKTTLRSISLQLDYTNALLERLPKP